jgi:spermidine/putrescine transport system permease protein
MTVLNQEQQIVFPKAAEKPPFSTILSQNAGRWLIAAESILGYVFLYAPIVILIIFSFNDSRSSAVWRGFTLDWYKSLWQGGGVLGLGGVAAEGGTFEAAGILFAFRNSLIVATISMVISTILGTMVALGMERFNFRLRRSLDILLYLPIIIPDITLGIAMAVFFNLGFNALDSLFGIHATLGFPTIIISHVAFNISFVAVVVRARLAGMDPALEEAAFDSGANEWQAFRHVTLPLIMPGIIGGALLAFTLSLDDFVITFFTTGIGTSTLPLFVYGMIKFTVTPAINAISSLMMLVSMILVTIALLLQRK